MDDMLRVAFDVFVVGTLVIIDLIIVATVCFFIKHVWLDASEVYEILKHKRSENNE